MICRLRSRSSNIASQIWIHVCRWTTKTELLWSSSKYSLCKLKGSYQAWFWYHRGQWTCTHPRSYSVIWFESWETSCLVIWVLRNMSRLLVLLAFFISIQIRCVTCVWQSLDAGRLELRCKHLWHLMSTVVTLWWLNDQESWDSYIAESNEFCCLRYQQHSIVRQRFVATTAWWAPRARCHRLSMIQARSVHISMPPWNCSTVLDGQLHANSRRHWSSTSAVCHSAQVDRTVLVGPSTEPSLNTFKHQLKTYFLHDIDDKTYQVH